jgi:8-oxo-dGTP pyrophosphatase MutT (NUDIX family)
MSFRRIPWILLLLMAAAAAPAQTQLDRSPQYLTESFWVDLEPPVAREGEEYPLSEEAAVRLLLEEARYVFGGMIYGFRFRYVPSDRRREVSEEFELEPIAELRFGDPRLSVLSTRVEDLRLHGRFEYRLADFQRSRRAGWLSGDVPSVGAEGEEPIWAGHDARIPAIEDAMRLAVRGLLRTMTDNKPREARGSLILLGSPRIYVRSAAYRARVDIRVKVDEIRQYTVY